MKTALFVLIALVTVCGMTVTNNADNPATDAVWCEDTVSRCYLEILGRQPDPAGLKTFTEHLKSGKDREWLEKALKDSKEYRNRQKEFYKSVAVVVMFAAAAAAFMLIPVVAIVKERRSKGPSAKLAPRIILILLSTGLTLLLLEIVFRARAHIIDAKELKAMLASKVSGGLAGETKMGDVMCLTGDKCVFYEMRKSTSFQWLGETVTMNSMGFRGKECTIEKEPGVKRIIGLGDSVIWGWGVGDEKTFLSVLERRLNAECAGRWETVNMGVPGYNIAMEVQAFRQKGLQLRPDIVIINYVANDFDPPPFFRPARDCLVLNKSFAVEYIGRQCGNISSKLRGTRTAYAANERGDEMKHLAGWEPFEAAVRELAAMGRTEGFRVLCTALEGHMSERMEALFRECGVEFAYPFDGYAADHKITNDINAYLGTELYLSRSDPHPSAYGHSVAAGQIFETLKSRQWVEMNPHQPPD